MTAYGASDATSHYHPITSSFIKTQIDLTFLVPAYTGCPGLEVATPIAPPPFRPRLPCSYLAKSRPQRGYWLPIL